MHSCCNETRGQAQPLGRLAPPSRLPPPRVDLGLDLGRLLGGMASAAHGSWTTVRGLGEQI